MDLTSSIGLTIVPSLVAGAIAILVVFINRWTSLQIHKEKFEFDKKISAEKTAHDRQQTAFERRFELAEQVLADAYQFKDMMEYVRNGAVFEGEGSTREKGEFESENDARNQTTYFVPVERLQKRSEFISTMMSRRTTCRAHFGSDAEKAFDLFHEAINRVRMSASDLIQMSSDKEPIDKNFREKLLQDIWQPLAEDKGEDQVGQYVHSW